MYMKYVIETTYKYVKKPYCSKVCLQGVLKRTTSVNFDGRNQNMSTMAYKDAMVPPVTEKQLVIFFAAVKSGPTRGSFPGSYPRLDRNIESNPISYSLMYIVHGIK